MTIWRVVYSIFEVYVYDIDSVVRWCITEDVRRVERL